MKKFYKTKLLIIFSIVFLCVGCGNMYFVPGFDSQLDTAMDEIVEAFDNRDAEALKNLLHNDTVSEDSNLDEEIQKAFDFYKGMSCNYYRDDYDGEGLAENGFYRQVAYSTITVTTEYARYLIKFTCNILDTENHDAEGIYAISIMPKLIFTQYYYDVDLDDINQAFAELPEEIVSGNGMDYKKFGLGVFTYDTETIKQLYYEKNGKEMPLSDVEEDYSDITTESTT